MADFEKALRYALGNEGGESDIQGDLGGHTNFGITQENLDAYNAKRPNTDFPANVHDLTYQNAESFYRGEGFWHYDNVLDQVVADKIFDLGVNCWTHEAVLVAQRALGAMGAQLSLDGVWGPATEAAINAADTSIFVPLFVKFAYDHYQGIVAEHPDQEKFLAGWLNRSRKLPNADQ